jgi:ring-1,2-phenylacetyl-CoA epoxidase subunit PaaE
VSAARDTLLERGVDPDRLHVELFFGYEQRNGVAQDYPASAVTIRLSGTEQTVELTAGDTILEAALQVRDDPPYACMGGACGTCKAKVLCGTVEMDQNFALGKSDLDAGYVLTCQAHPTTTEVTVDYDA